MAQPASAIFRVESAGHAACRVPRVNWIAATQRRVPAARRSAPSSTLTDTSTLRAQARKHVEDGAVTAGYAADREMVLKLLNEALATELVCVLRYRRHHFMARGINSKSIADEFLVHSNEEQGHADQLAERIVQLG
eukprot:gene3554-4568_t